MFKSCLEAEKDIFQPCCDPQLIGNSWPGTREAWMQRMGFSVFDYFVVDRPV